MNVIIVVVIVIIIIVVVVVVFVIIIVIVIVIYSVLGPPTYSLNLSNSHAVVPCFPLQAAGRYLDPSLHQEIYLTVVRIKILQDDQV